MEQRQWSTSDAVWLTALVVLLVALVFHKSLPRLAGGPPHDTYSVKMQGKRAFYLLTRERGAKVWRTRAPLKTVCNQLTTGNYFNGQTICILGEESVPTRDEWDALFKWVGDGGALIYAARESEFLDRHEGFEIKLPQIAVSIRSLWDDQRPDVLKRLVPGVQTLAPNNARLTWRTSGRISCAAKQFEELVTGENGSIQAVQVPFGRGNVLVCASDFVFSNQSIAFGDNSILAFRLLEKVETPGFVIFDESLNGSGLASGSGLLFSPRFVPFTLQCLIGLVLFGWWRSHRFGPLLPKIAEARHNIVDHTDAIGNIYFRSNDAASPLRLYLKQLVAELKLRSHKGQEEKVLAPIAVRMGKDTEQLMRVLKAANELRRDPKIDRRTSAQLIRRLARIRRAAQSDSIHRSL